MKYLQLFQRFWGLIILPPTLLGIWLFPSSVSTVSSEEVVAPWAKLASMISETGLLWTVVLVLSTWIIWTEVRPLIATYFQKEPDIYVQNEIHFESEIITGWQVYRVKAFLCVVNSRKDKKTLRNVGVRFSLIGPATQLFLRKSSEHLVDLRHGEYALFEIGSTISKHLTGLPQTRGDALNELEKAELEHNLPKGHLSFNVSRGGEGSIANPSGVELSYFPFRLIVSADDMESRIVHVDMDLRKLPKLDAFRVVTP